MYDSTILYAPGDASSVITHILVEDTMILRIRVTTETPLARRIAQAPARVTVVEAMAEVTEKRNNSNVNNLIDDL